MIHRFVNLPSRPLIPIPFVLYTTKTVAGVQSFPIQVWYVSQTPGQDLTVISGVGPDEPSGDSIADPVPSPDGKAVVWAYMNSVGANTIGGWGVGDTWGPSTSGIGSAQPSLLFTSMEPWWRPDSSGIVYRTLDDSPSEGYIRTCDVDTDTGTSSNDTLLLTIDRSTRGDPLFPTYSYDGSKIVYGINQSGNDTIRSMNADGTGDAQIATTIGSLSVGEAFSVGNTANVVAYTKKNGANTELRKVNMDGTGDTLLYTDTTTNPVFGLSRRAWAADDSAILYFIRDNVGTDPEFTLYSIDASGGGATVLSTLTSYGSTNDDLAYVYGNRVYWQAEDTFNNGTQNAILKSAAFDGSDVRQEFDLSPAPSPYDELDWIGGFAGFNNQNT